MTELQKMNPAKKAEAVALLKSFQHMLDIKSSYTTLTECERAILQNTKAWADAIEENL